MGVRLAYFNKPYNFEGNAVLHEDHNDLINRDIPKQHPMYAIIGLNEVISAIENLLTDHTDRIDAIETHLITIDEDLTAIHLDIEAINARIDGLRTIESTIDTDTALLDYHYEDKSLECNVRVFESQTLNGWNRLRIVNGKGLCVPSDQFADTSSILWELDPAIFPDDNLEKIYQNGIFFNHYSSSTSNVYTDTRSNWSYNSNDGITYFNGNGNTSSYHEGFVSGSMHRNFRVMASLGSTASDDDALSFLLYVTDEITGVPSTLSVLFSTNRLNGSLMPSNYCVYYNYRLPGEKLIKQASDTGNVPSLAAGTTPNGAYWNYYPEGIRVYVTKEGNRLKIQCSNFNSITVYSDYDINIDLDSDPDLEKFDDLVRFGFGSVGQGYTFIHNYYFSEDDHHDYYDVYKAIVKISSTPNNGIDVYQDGLWTERFRISSQSNNRLKKLADGTYFVQDIVLDPRRKNGLKYTDGSTRGTLWCREVLDYKEVTQASHGFVVGDFIYYHPTEMKYKKALAVDDYDINTVGMVTYVNGNTFEYMWSGFFETNLFKTSNGFHQGVPLYLSDVTAGGVVQRQPDISKSVGYPVEDVGIVINLERGIQYNNEANIGDFKRSTNNYDVRTDGFIKINDTNQYKLSLVSKLVDYGVSAEFKSTYMEIDELRQVLMFKNSAQLKSAMGCEPGIELFIKAF